MMYDWKLYGTIILLILLVLSLNLNTEQKKVSQKQKLDRAEIIMRKIAYVETRHYKEPYKFKSKATGKDRAYGKYQVMGANIPAWTKEATGKRYTKEEFLNSPELQEKTVRFQIKQYIKYGNDNENIASIWFTGKPLKQARGAKDAYGTTVHHYIKAFNRG